MGRWSYLDTDEERLPEGMTRVGYDADTQVYTYRDSDGSYWEGAPGCRYGKLHRVRSATPPLPSVHIPDNVEGDEAPYILYDSSDLDDDDDDDHTLPASPHDNDDEKKHTLASPDKAKLHNGANPPPHHPALAKTLPDLPTTTDDTSSLSGTTTRDSVITAPSDVTYKEKHHSHNHTNSSSLKRTGTLSRIARLFSSSSSSSSKRNVSRRATFNGGTAAGSRDRHGGGRDGKGARLARRSTAAEAGQWPSAGAGSGAAPGGGRVRKRATTFDEILGKD